MLNEQLAQLPHLVSFGVAAHWLQGNDFRQVWRLKDVVTAPDSLLKAQCNQQGSEIAEADVGVGLAAEDALEQTPMAIQRGSPSLGLARNGCPGRT